MLFRPWSLGFGESQFTLPELMLSSLVRLPPSTSPEPEDIFSSALGLIFTDELCNQHGDPGSRVIYRSKIYGDIQLCLVDPHGEDNRKLFAHYLWNAGVLMAEFVAGSMRPERGGVWDVRGTSVLELGAGTGLAGIVSALAGAERVVISDYPALEVLANIKVNLKKNVPHASGSPINVQGHQWGTLSDDFSQSNRHAFTRVLAADCLWMPWEHHDLIQSMLHFLSLDPDARVWVIAGFHTGRAKVAPFFVIAEDEGLEIEAIWERDADGNERDWAPERDGGREDISGRKWWLVVASLRRSSRNLQPQVAARIST